MHQPSPAEILKALRESTIISDPFMNEALAKALGKSTFGQSSSATSGITFYDLELGAKFLYPVPTPLRNMIPRVSGKGGIQASWRGITGINVQGMRIGVSAGNRGGVQAVSTKDYLAAYKGFGLESNVDFEAQYAAQGFDDVRAIAAKTGLEATMLGEEAMILGGNTSVALGTTPTPTLSASTTGGLLATATLSVICVALSFDAVVNGSVVGGIQSMLTRTNADGSTDVFGGGAAKQSINATVAVTGPTGSVLASVAPVSGAMGYAWFWGPAGSEILGAITTINSTQIAATPTGTQTAASLGSPDASTNALSFDGLLYLALHAGSGAYLAVQPTGTAGIGTPLTADGAGGVVEIETALKYFWDTLRLSPDAIWVNSQEAKNISVKILQGSANSAYRIVVDQVKDALGGGIMVRTYANKYSMAGANTLDIKVHPNMPAGTIFFTTSKLPYAMSNITNLMQMRMRQDYYQVEWPLRTRKYESGVYADGVLQHYFTPSLGIVTNIANG